jgi:hypothetical protein
MENKRNALYFIAAAERAHILKFSFLFFSKKEQQIKQKRKAKQQGQNEARKKQ